MGGNNSRRASLDSLLPSAFSRMCLRKTCVVAKVLLASFRYQLLQNLIKKDDHGFCHSRWDWEPSFQTHLCLQSETKNPPVWLKQESV